ncbi:MAG: hypothetical protein U1F54_01960 [Burkholderiales bacterium]
MGQAKGWLEGAAYVVVIGVLSLAYAVGHRLGAHPVAFILYAMIATALATLVAFGTGPEALAIVRHPLSWIAGLAIILVEVFYFQTITYVAPAHGNVVVRIATPLAIVTGWALLGRRPLPVAWLGGAVVVLGVATIVAFTPPAVRWPMAIMGTLTGACMVVRGFAGELHPINRAARTVRDKLRFTGVVVLVTAAMSLATAALAAIAVASGALPATRMLPTLQEMAHVPTIVLGGLGGGAILTLMMVLNFSAVVKIGTANFTALMAFSPLAIWVFQEAGVALGWIEAARPDASVVAAMVVCIAGVLLIFLADVLARRVAPGAARR